MIFFLHLSIRPHRKMKRRVQNDTNHTIPYQNILQLNKEALFFQLICVRRCLLRFSLSLRRRFAFIYRHHHFHSILLQYALQKDVNNWTVDYDFSTGRPTNPSYRTQNCTIHAGNSLEPLESTIKSESKTLGTIYVLHVVFAKLTQ